MPTPLIINGKEAKHGDIIFFGNAENPTRTCMVVLYNEENDFWDIQQVSHAVAGALNPELFRVAVKKAWGSEDTKS